MKYEEKELSLDMTVAALTESVANLAVAVQNQNNIILCLLHKFNIETDLPTWQNKEIFEKEMATKVEACNKVIGKIYGPSKTDKS